MIYLNKVHIVTIIVVVLIENSTLNTSALLWFWLYFEDQKLNILSLIFNEVTWRNTRRLPSLVSARWSSDLPGWTLGMETTWSRQSTFASHTHTHTAAEPLSSVMEIF